MSVAEPPEAEVLQICLGSLCEVVRGSSPRPKSDPRFYDGPVPRLMVSDLTRDGMYVSAKTDSLTLEGAKKSRPMKGGDVVIAVSGAPGLPAILKTDCCIHDGFVGLRGLDTSRILPEYLYRFLSFAKDASSNSAVGAIFKNLTTDQIRDIAIPLPSLAEQVRIAGILDKADAIRRKRQQAIELTEQLLRSTFLEMFGDPVTQKKKWDFCPLSDVITKITNGYVGPTRNIYEEKGVPYILAKHIKAGVIKFTEKDFVNDDFNQKHSKSILRKGDVLLVQSGINTGDSAVVPQEHAGHNCHALIIIAPMPNVLSGTFLSFWYSTPVGRATLRRIFTGATIPHLNCRDVKEVKVPVPPYDLQVRFAKITQQNLVASTRLSQTAQEFDSLFNSLVQRAFRGEL